MALAPLVPAQQRDMTQAAGWCQDTQAWTRQGRIPHRVCPPEPREGHGAGLSRRVRGAGVAVLGQGLSEACGKAGDASRMGARDFD